MLPHIIIIPIFPPHFFPPNMFRPPLSPASEVLSSTESAGPSESMIHEAFDVFDVDGDGEISLSELRVMLSGAVGGGLGKLLGDGGISFFFFLGGGRGSRGMLVGWFMLAGFFRGGACLVSCFSMFLFCRGWGGLERKLFWLVSFA